MMNTVGAPIFDIHSMQQGKPQLSQEADDLGDLIEIVTVGMCNGINSPRPIKERTLSHSSPANEPLAHPPILPTSEMLNSDQKPPALLSVKASEEATEKEIKSPLPALISGQLPQVEEVSRSLPSLEQVQEYSNVSKSEQLSGNGKKAAKSESQSQRREQVPSSRKCFNRMCSSKKIYKKIRSRVEDNKYRFFCKTCYENYFHNLYCEFCEQIYSTNCENEDDDKWIGCDNCERWNHIDCERKNRQKNIQQMKDKNMLYQCLLCSQRNRSAGDKSKKERERERDRDREKDVGEEKQVEKQKGKVEANKDQKRPIFNKKTESFPNLESFLQNYSFRLWMNQSQIRDDLDQLRSICLKIPQQEQGRNKTKKVKTD